MFSRTTISAGTLAAILAAACASGSGAETGPGEDTTPGEGGAGSGGARGSGRGGAQPAAAGGAPGSGGGGAGSGGLPAPAGSGGSVAPTFDAAADQAPVVPDGGGSVNPPAGGQGPTAEGKIAYSQDFEQNMDGMSRSPANLPEDRIQIIDDPVGQRGKIVRIMFKDGDNFRTSPGTQPRSWFSAAKGYTVKPGSKVSLAWGFMWENVNMNAHFAQIIRDGGPIWMWDVDGGGNVSMTFHRGSGATGNIMKLEPMKWYDFMVVTDYRDGGECRFYLNGKMVGTGRSVGGADARFDFGIYTRPGAHPARTVFISNVSIGEL